MIVLDEQFMGRGIETAIARWYPGAVRFITDLRPNTVIKDDAIPTLLQQESEPTFVTINESDFWREVAITNHFCVICFVLPDPRAIEIPDLLQRLLRHPDFQTKSQRMGRVVRLTTANVSYYTTEERTVRSIKDWFV